MITKAHNLARRNAFADIDIKGLAKQLRTSPGVIYGIKYGRMVSARRAIEIESITGKMGKKIDRSILRPDIFGD